MDAPNSIHDVIDLHTQNIVLDMKLAVSSLEGIHSRIYRSMPSIRGLGEFMKQTEDVPAAAARLFDNELGAYLDATLFHRTAFNLESPGNHETRQIAIQQVSTLIEQLRLEQARRFRAALVSRSSIAPPTQALRVLNRAGQSFEGREMLYLIVRKALIDLFNEAEVEGLRSEGISTAQIKHRYPDHEVHGLTILIDEEMTGLPTYSEVASKWFHPRSNAVVTRSNA